MNDSQPRMIRVVATAFFLFAIAFLGLSAPLYWNQWKVLHRWPRTPATVIRSDVVALNPVQGQTLYDTEYVLNFPAHGKRFTVVLRSNRPSTNYRRKARDAAQLPTGSIHLISYNPVNPVDIRTRPGYNIHFFLVPVVMTAIGLAFAFVGGLLWLLSGRNRKDTYDKGDSSSYPEIRQRIA